VHGFVIAHVPCPRCGHAQTVRLGYGSFCFNCRWQWGAHSVRNSDTQVEASPAGTAVVAPRERLPFTVAELARLESYRAAVQAGFYTDELRA
jgi:hypothetical protein